MEVAEGAIRPLAGSIEADFVDHGILVLQNSNFYYIKMCMKATADQLAKLKERITEAVLKRRLSQHEISQLGQVHPSQVSRICRGEFKTLSNNVMQICNILELELETIAMPATELDVSWSRLEASLRKIWDNTPAGADKVVRMLDAIRKLRSG